MSEIKFWRAVASILALGVAIIFFYHVWSVILPFVFGLVIAYLIHPLVDHFSGYGLRRDRVTVVLYAFFLVVGVLLGSWLLPGLYREANAALSDLPSYAQAVNGIIDNANKEIQAGLNRFLGDGVGEFEIPFRAENLVETLFTKLPENILNVAHMSLWVFIIPFVSFFALSQGKRWIDLLFQWTPSDHVEGLLGLVNEVNAALGGYVRGVLLESTCVGFLTIFGLMALGIKGSILIGVVTGLLNVVPFLALFVGGAIAMMAGYFQTQSMTILIGIFVLYGVVRLIDDFFIIPFVMGHSVKLHPLWILFAILAGVELGGFVGLVFAIPLAAVIKVVFTVVVHNRQNSIIPQKQYVHS